MKRDNLSIFECVSYWMEVFCCIQDHKVVQEATYIFILFGALKNQESYSKIYIKRKTNQLNWNSFKKSFIEIRSQSSYILQKCVL